MYDHNIFFVVSFCLLVFSILYNFSIQWNNEGL